MSKQNIMLVVGVTVGIIVGFMLGRMTAPGPTPRFVHLEHMPSDQMFDNKTGLKCSTSTYWENLKENEEKLAARINKPYYGADDPLTDLIAKAHTENFATIAARGARFSAADGTPYCSSLVKWYEK